MFGKPGRWLNGRTAAEEAGDRFSGWSVDVFEDPKIDRLIDGQGIGGFAVYFYLCQRAYGLYGYYLPWTCEDAPTAARRLGGGVVQELGDAVRGRCRVVAADRHEQLDVVVGEELEVEVVFEIRILGLETAHLQERTSLVEDAVGHGVVDVHHAGRRVEEPRVALVQADYAVTFAEESLCDAAYHGVHTGCGAAASQNCDCFFHDCDWVFMFEPELT